jgi:SAM-dependent methyltransferase
MTISSDWWRTFFSGSIVDFWLRCTTDEQTNQEADFIQKVLQTSAPARLLDVPCGGGRHSIALARRGCTMTGVDISGDFLKAARSAAVAPHGNITWEEREMRDLPWPGAFDGAFSFGNSFAYLDETGNADFLKAVASVLKSGSRFILETGYVLEGLLPVLQTQSWVQLGDMIVLSQRRYDPPTSRLEVEYTIIQDGKIEKRAMTARLYSYRELARLMEDAGFTEVQGFGSFQQEPFKLGSPRLLMVVTKK